jgi:DNA-binding LytR/AlgR family response regulator
MKATALIAEDEPLLATSLAAELRRAWPELAVVASVGDGESALTTTLELAPDVVFMDIRMPGMTGLDAARALAEDWPEAGPPFPLIVFVTAYDQYALEAFDRSAVDYVLKPVQPARLAATVRRLQDALGARSGTAGAAPAGDLGRIVAQLRGLLGPSNAAGAPEVAATGAASAPLQVIQAGVGNAIHIVPIGEVVYFEAADKYVRVVTADREHLIRTSLRELVPLLDPARFWQIHRGTVVRADAIASAVRDDGGKLVLALRGRPEKLVVSRLYGHLFKAM